MRVSEVVLDLQKRFPRSPIDAWEASYYDALRPFEGQALDTAYRDTMREWAEHGPPKPAHIVAAIRIPQDGDKPKPPWIVKDEQRDARRKQLLATWRGELAEWFAVAKSEAWAGHLERHLGELASAVAHSEIDAGRNTTGALAWANGRDRRAGYGMRAPDVLVDDDDAAIFRAQAESQARFSRGLKRGDREPPWRLSQPEAPAAPDLVAEHLAKRRAEINALIPDAARP